MKNRFVFFILIMFLVPPITQPVKLTPFSLNSKITAAPASTDTPPASSSAVPPASRHQFYSDEMKTVVLTNHVLSHFNEYCYRCMSCKISWPDRTQLLKHAQECSNSQVVRTKTKYKLKANCRLQLKFYLQTYIDYWMYEKSLEMKSVEQLASLNSASAATVVSAQPEQKLLDCRVFLNDVILNRSLLLETSSRHQLNSVSLDEGRRMVLKDEEDRGEEAAASTTEMSVDEAVAVEVESNVKKEEAETVESSSVPAELETDEREKAEEKVEVDESGEDKKPDLTEASGKADDEQI